ncbi:hypothetical protein BG006_004169 [Podila minutissima]|uniref:Auxin efflux carrier n=1 Tax=Podila minutissima TaxID=64525 RepID=A0A9P5VMV6_9FUNG|nr:hypothetical protein BG006_004169 [Podila minutissima]
MVALSTLIWTSAKPILKFLVLGGCGAIMARHGLLTPAGAKVVAGLILNYTLPALLFAKMLSCVNQENAKELGLVAVCSALILLMGGFFGIIIQRFGRVPKRLRRGIIAASMFTNFGDLPISIILAVSDHPPFLVGDGARGTAYSSVFIAVFYLFLFPFQGYRLIRYDHIKEAKRLASLTEVMNTPQGRTLEEQRNMGNFSNTSEVTLAGTHQRSETSKCQNKDGLLQSPQMPHRFARPENTTFSATSTMISMDGPTEFYDEDHDNRARELRYHPDDESPKERRASPSPSRLPSREGSNDWLAGEPNPFIHTRGQEQSDSDLDMSRTNTLTNHGPHSQQVFSMNPLKAAGSPYSHVINSPEGRFSVESTASNGTGVSRFSSAHDDDRRLIPDKSPRARTRTNTGKGYRPPPLIQRPQPMYSGPYSAGGTGPSSSGSSTPSKPSSPSPFISLTPPETRDHAKLGSSSSNDTLTNVPLEADTAPLPKVPPALQGTYNANHTKTSQWIRLFNAMREYLTPPTLGLLLGLLVALTPLRVLFVVTDTPVASPDELPPLSFIHEITLLLGGCCVPLGLTVLGASLSRLKPGRMRPLVPALTMITISKLIISPLIGIAVVQLVLVRQLGWVPEHNNMLQFTLMLMSGSPTSITCFVLAQVWDRRTKNAGSEMAAVIAVQYAASTVLLTVLSACMMYFLF